VTTEYSTPTPSSTEELGPVPRSSQKVVAIDAITIGPRYRQELGDLNSLAASIKDMGLLHPIVITPKYQLIAGQRRLEACKLLGWLDVPVHVVDLDQLVAGEYAENTVRKDFTPSEAVAIAKALKPKVAEQAEQRKAAGGKLPPAQRAKTRDHLGQTVGMSGRSLEKATAVVNAAQQDPEKFVPVVEEMDRTGKVDAAYRELNKAKLPAAKGIGSAGARVLSRRPPSSPSTGRTACIRAHGAARWAAHNPRYRPEPRHAPAQRARPGRRLPGGGRRGCPRRRTRLGGRHVQPSTSTATKTAFRVWECRWRYCRAWAFAPAGTAIPSLEFDDTAPRWRRRGGGLNSLCPQEDLR
jgi:hypothetical protein